MTLYTYHLCEKRNLKVNQILNECYHAHDLLSVTRNLEWNGGMHGLTANFIVIGAESCCPGQGKKPEI